MVKYARILLSVGAVCLLPVFGGAEQAPLAEVTLFNEANAAYDGNDFAAAADRYKQALEAGLKTGEVLYNLGNCYFRMGKLGMAMVYYERARQFMPRNQSLLGNIALSESRALDKISPPKIRALGRKLFSWHRRLTARELSLILIAANAAFWASLATLAIRRSRSVKLAVVFIGIILVLSGFSHCLRQIERRGPGSAFVVTYDAEVRTGPGDYAVRFKLHDGTRVRLVDSREGWCQIRLADGKRGWIKAENVEKI